MKERSLSETAESRPSKTEHKERTGPIALLPMHGQCESIVALLGHPIAHSLSPVMQNAGFRALGLPYRYVAFDVKSSVLPMAVAGLKGLGFAGANVTIPHKVEVMNYLDTVDGHAKEMGAVNTIVLEKDGRLSGYNTDAPGLLNALEQDASFCPAGKSALIFGAGGAARAATFALASAGLVSLTIVNRTIDNARSLKDAVAKAYPSCRTSIKTSLSEKGSGQELLLSIPDLIINATPLGMWPDRLEKSPLSLEDLSTLDDLCILAEQCVVVDLVYQPSVTKFLDTMIKRGARAVSGLSVLLHQGAIAFTLWTGKPAPIEAMKISIGLA
jgi:shikimate dehydrogenase